MGVKNPRSAVQVLSILTGKSTGSDEFDEFHVSLFDDAQRFTLYWCHCIVFGSKWYKMVQNNKMFVYTVCKASQHY